MRINRELLSKLGTRINALCSQVPEVREPIDQEKFNHWIQGIYAGDYSVDERYLEELEHGPPDPPRIPRYLVLDGLRDFLLEQQEDRALSDTQ
jgi:hypothetical protein